MKKICANPFCKKEFDAHNGNIKYCSIECAKYIHQKQEHHYEKYIDRPCEVCGNEHDHSYGSGRFCSKECRMRYIASINRNSKSPKVKAHLDKLRKEGKVGKTKAPYGTWKCDICERIFESRRLLKLHKHEEHKHLRPEMDDNGKYVCPYCDNKYDNRLQLYGHLSGCKNHPNKKNHDLAHKRSIETLSKRFKAGEVHGSFLGKHHSREARIKMRESTLKYIENMYGCSHRYNKNSIPILESIAKEHGWNLQHAENGGEFYTGIGFYVDGYDKEKNIVVEYDEKDHYRDYRNNILRDKDIERQREIIEHLHCEFYRYNEATGILWKVEIKNEDLHKSSA